MNDNEVKRLRARISSYIGREIRDAQYSTDDQFYTTWVNAMHRARFIINDEFRKALKTRKTKPNHDEELGR